MTTEPQQVPPQTSLKLDDIYFVLFRHKWKILLFAAAGVLAAAGLFFTRPPVYQSEAKLLVRYVQESRSMSPVTDRDQIKSPDDRGENIINSELEILTSLDLAREVVDLVGAERIIGKVAVGNVRDAAAVALRRQLGADVPRKSNIIRVTFQHSDPEVVQPVLERLIEVYRKKHMEIHRGIGIIDDFLSEQADQLRARLLQTEEELRKAKAKVGVIILEDSKTSYSEQITKLREDLLAAEAELQERKAMLKGSEPMAATQTASNATETVVAPEQISAYRDVCNQLTSLGTNRTAMLTRFRDDSPMIRQLQEEINRLEARKKKMEEEQPKLLASGITATPLTGTSLDVNAEMARIRMLEARTNILQGHLQKLRTEVGELDKAESEIVRLQRQKEIEDSNLKHYSASLEQARAGEAMGPGRVTNINTVQAPSPPARDLSKLKKPLIMALGGPMFAGLALAFLLELFLNQSVRRPAEIESRFNLPLLLSIPEFLAKGMSPVSRLARHLPLVKEVLPAAAEVNGNGATPEPSTAVVQHLDLREYSDALRDRLMTWFEARKLTQRPKLVAITSCSKGAGVSTIANGLAASLSEVGGGSVLLVDMDHGRAAAHPFLDGKPACSLHEAFEEEKPESSLALQNLYVASGNGAPDGLPKAMPKRFAHLMPKIKASDYDYIIFDMPAIDQTSVTPRLAGHMDLVLMVVEAERTSRDAVKRGVAALQESGATIAAVVNRTRNYVPGWLGHGG